MYTVCFYWKDGYEMSFKGFTDYDAAYEWATKHPNTQSPNYDCHDVVDDYDLEAMEDDDPYIGGGGDYMVDYDYDDVEEGDY